MKYVILSTLEYGSGRIAVFCSRFDNVFTGNNEQSPEFCRNLLQWSSGKGDNDLIPVLSVVNNCYDGGYRVLDLADKVNLLRGELDDLSNNVFIEKFDTICLFGIDNNLSPLIKLALKNYVFNGGGLILSDIHVDSDYIDLLNDISPVYCQSSGVNFSNGIGKWTLDGVGSSIYNKEFSSPKITVLNTISEYGLSSSWSSLYVYDTSENIIDEGIEGDVDGIVYLSSDYDISGDRMVGYFSGIYKNGILNVRE